MILAAAELAAQREQGVDVVHERTWKDGLGEPPRGKLGGLDHGSLVVLGAQRRA